MPTLDWIGKRAVINHHLTVPYRLLKGEEQLSAGEAGSGNLLVQGDNLLALKALLPYYAGQVKCIYIDPPYNTGNEGWVYNDNSNAPEIKKWLGQTVGGEAEDLSRHDKWLCMMHPRLALLRDFLTEDGVILVSIDDNEAHHARCLLDEIFGAQNHVGTFVWEGALKNDSRFISVSHDYVLCYARSLESTRKSTRRWRVRKEGIDEIYATVQRLREKKISFAAMNAELKEWYTSIGKNHPAWQHRHYNRIDDVDVYFPGDISWPGGGGPDYDVLHPRTGKPVVKPKRGWVFAQKETLMARARENRVEFGHDERQVPKLKRYLHETEGSVLPSVFYADRRAARQKLRNIMGADVFENPKDPAILMMLLEALADPRAIVLDSFAGSGSTAQAVLELNKIDNGHRRFLCIEMEKDICRDVTAQRIRKLINGYGDTPGLGGGFRFATLGTPLFDEHGQISGDVHFADLARHVYFSETGEPQPNTTNGKTPLIGVCGRTAYYLLFNGILGDKTAAGGNVLTDKILRQLPAHPMGSDNPRVIFGEGCRLGAARLEREGIIFKQLPYEIKVN